jgi:ribosomal-protein-alanine N-acetyltransferase
MSAILKDPLLRLRPMDASDVEAVFAIEAEAYEFPWSRGIFLDCLRVGYCCWIGALGREVVGYGVMSVAVGESHILNLCVRPDLQRQGLGRTLLERLLGIARGHRADTAFLEVRPSNRAAICLYLAMGFNQVGVRRAYYPARGGREDALILARSL